MDNFVYNAFDGYFRTAEKLGYVSQKKVESLLVLDFFYNLIYHDYRGYIGREDYHTLEQAINCLYGTNCLIPYPDYLKMGKLKLGEMTEVLDRIKVNEEVLDIYDKRITDNDVLIEDNIRRLDEHGTHLARHDEEIAEHERRLDAHDETLADHENRIIAVEGTKVMKGKNHIQNIPDIDLSLYDQIND